MKKAIQIIMVLCLLFSIVPQIKMNAYGASANEFQYSKSSRGITITKYLGTDTDVVIPDEIDGKPVYAIDGAFKNQKITSVVIPDSVTHIYGSSFQDCTALTDVAFGKNVQYIGGHAFYECTKLKKIILPQSLTRIDGWAFVCSSSMRYIVIPSSVTEIGTEGIGFKRSYIYVDPNDPFTKPVDDFTIIGDSGSTAEEYARKYGFEFIDVADAFNITAKGASLRTTLPGIRFGFQLNNESSIAFEDLYLSEFGFVYAYSDKTANLSVDNTGKNGVFKKTADNFVQTDNAISYNLVFTNIPKGAYGQKMSVRAYAVINDVIYYSDVISYSVDDVLDMILSDDEIDREIKDKLESVFMV